MASFLNLFRAFLTLLERSLGREGSICFLVAIKALVVGQIFAYLCALVLIAAEWVQIFLSLHNLVFIALWPDWNDNFHLVMVLRVKMSLSKDIRVSIDTLIFELPVQTNLVGFYSTIFY